MIVDRGGLEQIPPEPARVCPLRRRVRSPWVRAYFDVGNVVFYGFPQDWIRTLGSRIVRVHLKDFTVERGAGTFTWKNIGEGDIDWPEVRQALTEIAYDGYMTTEIEGGDESDLADVVGRLDRVSGRGEAGRIAAGPRADRSAQRRAARRERLRSGRDSAVSSVTSGARTNSSACRGGGRRRSHP